MEIRYLSKDEYFSDDISEEVIEISNTNGEFKIEAIISASTGKDAISKFFCLLKNEQHEGKLIRLKLDNLRDYAFSLFNKGKNSSRGTYNRHKYSWTLEEISSDKFYIFLHIHILCNKYIYTLKELSSI